MSQEKPRHAVMVIDMPAATPTEIKDVFNTIRQCAEASPGSGWPDEFAVLLDGAADEITARVRASVESRRSRGAVPHQRSVAVTSYS